MTTEAKPACTCVVGKCIGVIHCLACDRLGWHRVKDQDCKATVHVHGIQSAPKPDAACTCPWYTSIIGRSSGRDPACPLHGIQSAPETPGGMLAATSAQPLASAETDAWRKIADDTDVGPAVIALHEAADALDAERDAHEATKRELSEITLGSMYLTGEIERLTRELAEAYLAADHVATIARAGSDEERHALALRASLAAYAPADQRAELARRSGK